MVLKNEHNCQKEVDLIFKLNKNKQEYLVYKDNNTNKYYGGIKEDKKLKPLEDDDVKMLENFLEKLNRSEWEYEK